MSVTSRSSRAAAVCAAIAVVVLNGCTERVSDPDSARAAESALGAAAPRGDATASLRWSAIARDFVAAQPTATKPNPVAVLRAFAYLSLAQYRAVAAADDARGRSAPASPQGAVGAASATVLSALFPGDTATFAAQLRQQESEATGTPAAQSAFAAGEALGRTVGAAIVALARVDGFDLAWTGAVPNGPGYWSSDFDPPRPPQLPMLGRMRPFFMTSGDQFRPGPPPAFGTPRYVAALEEVRRFSDHRTDEQLRIAQFWALTDGSLVAGFWNTEASKLIAHYQLGEAQAARALALVHMAAMDANIACYDAKYTYWFIRPYRADPAITTPIGRPNHPSYPSNHGCVSGTSAYVLAALFPADAARLAAMADEAAESRLYAGIHYRFDKDASLGIARAVAALAMARGLTASIR
ncbi:phosphoesterase PA-phosphatase related protein [Gemmatirosa kalamazoonensis]|uniref:Phosphoesterase PA-phosphatase related protein n=1 Tax=Gemmatirosa kalamazoonensis TaxID=861299 RepID=W0RG17_9BACT|nr:vanadium-dependent haloperoxidase [Gemmatirosa kalamazoonensis]AHG89265.1 phosphoesterase PA-phosphatase related protein [Gemmatirosa kalamazoonensis]